MKFKKLSAILLALSMLGSLAACSGDTASSTGGSADGGDASQADAAEGAVTDGDYGGLVALPDAVRYLAVEQQEHLFADDLGRHLPLGLVGDHILGEELRPF